MGNILSMIADYARIRVAGKKKIVPLTEIKAAAFSTDCATGFLFEQALAGNDIKFICECKKASPSKGIIAPEFPYLEIAREYEKAGAACISVLTEPKWFMGRDEYLKEIAAAVSIPCLRKDFIVDEYMIYEAKTLGASAVLLICSLLNSETIRRYIDICDGLGLSALIEAHDEDEIAAALKAGARIIGVNNRNLRDFTVDIHRSERLRKLVPESVLFVAESGIKTADDIDILQHANVNGVLIGETLMCAADKKAMLDDLRGRQ
jgi:indole-3-glycerol phosphate synthase